MVTLTFTWWGFILYFLALGVLGYAASRLGDRAGRALRRWWRRRKSVT